MALHLKKAEEGELHAINELIVESEIAATGRGSHRDAFRAAYRIERDALQANDCHALYDGQTLVGFFMIKSDGAMGAPELEYFYIAHDRFGLGYGTQMWRFVVEVCVLKGFRGLNVACGKYVTEFYRKMGAQKMGERDSKVYRGERIDLLRCEF